MADPDPDLLPPRLRVPAEEAVPPLAVGVDVGGTWVRAHLVDARGRVVGETRLRKERTREGGGDAVVDQVVRLVREEVARAPAPVAVVGVGVPGPTDARSGVVLAAPNLPGWTGLPLRDRLADALGLPVVVANDASVAAWGEYRHGAGAGADAHGAPIEDLVYLTASTGVGAGAIAGGRLLSGSTGLAFEVGHVCLLVNGPECACGGRGHLEAFLSGTSIAREAALVLRRGRKTSLREGTTAADVVAAARAGDEEAAEILERAGAHLGHAAAVLVQILNPQRIVVGGSVALAGDLLFEPARRHAERHVMTPFLGTFDLVPAQLGGAAGIVGAAAYARDHKPTARREAPQTP